MDKAVAVLGGGNGGRCMAADLTLRGFKVNFYEHPSFEESIREIKETGIIDLVSIDVSGAAKINKVTTVMEEALSDADIINVILPSFAHDIFYEEMILLQDGQTVIVDGGFWLHTALQLAQEKFPKKCLLETNTLPHGSRITPEGWIDYHVLHPRYFFPACRQ